MWVRLVLVGTACVACGDSARARTPSALEAQIAHELGQRAGARIDVRCLALPPRCRATLPDRTEVTVRLRGAPDRLEWALDGVLVRAEPIEQYLRDTLADLGAPQAARCGPRVQVLAADARIACALDGGGTAFVRVRADGSLGFDLALGPEAAGTVTDAELVQLSRQLESAAASPDQAPAEGGD